MYGIDHFGTQSPLAKSGECLFIIIRLWIRSHTVDKSVYFIIITCLAFVAA